MTGTSSRPDGWEVLEARAVLEVIKRSFQKRKVAPVFPKLAIDGRTSARPLYEEWVGRYSMTWGAALLLKRITRTEQHGTAAQLTSIRHKVHVQPTMQQPGVVPPAQGDGAAAANTMEIEVHDDEVEPMQQLAAMMPADDGP